MIIRLIIMFALLAVFSEAYNRVFPSGVGAWGYIMLLSYAPLCRFIADFIEEILP
jgi:hypothetical protein